MTTTTGQHPCTARECKGVFIPLTAQNTIFSHFGVCFRGFWCMFGVSFFEKYTRPKPHRQAVYVVLVYLVYQKTTSLRKKQNIDIVVCFVLCAFLYRLKNKYTKYTKHSKTTQASRFRLVYNCKFDTPNIHQNIHQTYTKIHQEGRGLCFLWVFLHAERRIDPEEPTPEELHRLPFWIRHGSSRTQTGGKICPSGGAACCGTAQENSRFRELHRGVDPLETISSRTLTEERKQKLFGKAIAFCIIDDTKPTTKNGTAAKCAINCTAPAGYGGGYPHPRPLLDFNTVTAHFSLGTPTRISPGHPVHLIS